MDDEKKDCDNCAQETDFGKMFLPQQVDPAELKRRQEMDLLAGQLALGQMRAQIVMMLAEAYNKLNVGADRTVRRDACAVLLEQISKLAKLV